MPSKTKKKIRKNSIKKKYTGGQIYEFKDIKKIENGRIYSVNIDINDYNLESFKKLIIESIYENGNIEFENENFHIFNDKKKKPITNLSELTSVFYFWGKENDPLKGKRRLTQYIEDRTWQNGNCSDPKYPGSHMTEINLNEVIDKIKEYIQLDNINSIELFIGQYDQLLRPCAKIIAYSNTQKRFIAEHIWMNKFPLNIPSDLSISEDPQIQNLNKFLKDLSSIVLSEKGQTIRWKVINNICCTCFPIFEHLTTKLKFEYFRNEGQGCGWCKGTCETFARTCIRP